MVATTLLLAIGANPQPMSADAAGGCPGASVEATFLCVALEFSITGSNKHEFVLIDWGDGTDQGEDCPRINGECGGTIPHTYAEPGTYTIEVTAISGACASSSQSLTLDVADAPDLGVHAVDQGPLWVRPGTSDPLDPAKLRRSTVDWGDGSPAEEFDWTVCADGVLCLPRHDYAAAGTYTITARVEYRSAWDETCYVRDAGIEVEIEGSTAAEPTTWGIVKSRYR